LDGSVAESLHGGDSLPHVTQVYSESVFDHAAGFTLTQIDSGDSGWFIPRVCDAANPTIEVSDKAISFYTGSEDPGRWFYVKSKADSSTGKEERLVIYWAQQFIDADHPDRQLRRIAVKLLDEDKSAWYLDGIYMLTYINELGASEYPVEDVDCSEADESYKREYEID
jgi:hypothetical protein